MYISESEEIFKEKGKKEKIFHIITLWLRNTWIVE